MSVPKCVLGLSFVFACVLITTKGASHYAAGTPNWEGCINYHLSYEPQPAAKDPMSAVDFTKFARDGVALIESKTTIIMKEFKDLDVTKKYGENDPPHLLVIVYDGLSCRSSQFGYQGVPVPQMNMALQLITLAKDCLHPGYTVPHEVGHALSILHEQQRADQDKYISIDYTKLASGAAGAWVAIPETHPLLPSISGDYDHLSLMHYFANLGLAAGTDKQNDVVATSKEDGVTLLKGDVVNPANTVHPGFSDEDVWMFGTFAEPCYSRRCEYPSQGGCVNAAAVGGAAAGGAAVVGGSAMMYRNSKRKKRSSQKTSESQEQGGAEPVNDTPVVGLGGVAAPGAPLTQARPTTERGVDAESRSRPGRRKVSGGSKGKTSTGGRKTSKGSRGRSSTGSAGRSSGSGGRSSTGSNTRSKVSRARHSKMDGDAIDGGEALPDVQVSEY